MYKKQSVTAQWNNCQSDSFSVSNGVGKEQSFLHFLFRVCLDKLIYFECLLLALTCIKVCRFQIVK